MRTTFIVNGYQVGTDTNQGIERVVFDFLDEKVHAAQKYYDMFGVFVSNVVEAPSAIVSWKELSWSETKYENTDVRVYLKTASTVSGLDSADWYGPYLNSSGNDISELKKRYMRFVVVLRTNSDSRIVNYQNETLIASPVINNLTLSFYSSGSSVRFYTKAFNIGFSPKHILLTYNGNVDTDSIVRFAVSGFDSVDSSDYQYIDPNKIEELSELSILSEKIKVMIEMVAGSEVPITIDEFAIMFSGDIQERVNKEEVILESSSSSSLSSSSS